MRIEVIEADGLKIEVRGRTRRTSALESEYLLALKAAHRDMKSLPTPADKTVASSVEASPRGWSLAGVAANFRLLVARVHAVQIEDKPRMEEPFSGDFLATLFDDYLDCEELPDRSDVWSQVENTILKMDKPETTDDPNAEGGTQKK